MFTIIILISILPLHVKKNLWLNIKVKNRDSSLFMIVGGMRLAGVSIFSAEIKKKKKNVLNFSAILVLKGGMQKKG